MTSPHVSDEFRIRRFPEPTVLRLDSSTRRTDEGQTLIGGSPMRVVRLSQRGASIVAGWEQGETVGSSQGEQALARRLVDAGMAHPRVDAANAPALTVGVVIPVRDDPGVGDTIRALGSSPAGSAGVSEVVVVDDASSDFDAVARAIADAAADVAVRVRLERRTVQGGPGAARNVGWPSVEGDIVVFVDAGVIPHADEWLGLLLAHLADPSVAAVAPRVVGRGSPGDDETGWLDDYEALRSPLDMGDRPARVAPGSPVSYVPTAAVAIRRSALDNASGFDEGLRYGEDVDLVWRLVDAGLDVRYEPRATVTHPNRGSWTALARQRFSYGSSAAALDERHPGRLAPVAVNAWSLATWSAAATGPIGVAVAATSGAVSSAAQIPRLRGRVDDPVREAFRLGIGGHIRAGAALARACLRPWFPALVAAALFSRRCRRLLVAVAVGVPVAEWLALRPGIDPLRWILARLVDDASYSAGVWTGCRRRRRLGPMVPRLVRSPKPQAPRPRTARPDDNAWTIPPG